MRVDLTIDFAAVYGFLLVLARVSGALVFVPLPGFNAAPGPAKAALALGATVALYPLWPRIAPAGVTAVTLAGWAVAESAVGIAIGLTVAIALEAFVLAAQVLGLQAGYAYAQTVDPNTQADSGILLVFAQLMAGMLFLALGLDREILRLFAQSLERLPAAPMAFGIHSAEPMVRFASSIFSVGTRLALPVVALLVMVDVALALLGRLNSQLQLLSLAFPMKMLTALVVLGWIAILFPRILRESTSAAMAASRRVLGL